MSSNVNESVGLLVYILASIGPSEPKQTDKIESLDL